MRVGVDVGGTNTDAVLMDGREVVAWTNEYGEKKTKVFGTTLGHNTETCKDDRYLDLVTRVVEGCHSYPRAARLADRRPWPQ